MAQDVQSFLRSVDTGLTAILLRIGMMLGLISGIGVLYFMVHFKGLGTEQAMDHAQIARSLVAGEGFTTRYVRPLEIAVLKGTGRQVGDRIPEIYNAPIFPLVEAAALFPFRTKLDMKPSDILSKGDKVVAVFGILLMIVGVAVWYFVGAALFDRKIAMLGSGLLLVTDLMWQYAIAGLPQHLLIILFGLTTLCLVKARQEDEREGFPLPWLAGAGLLLGLMSLTHGLTVFLLPAVLAFCFFGFHARVISLGVPAAVYALTVLPWLIHNLNACGNPLGLSFYNALAGAGVTEATVMRGDNPGLSFGGGFATKLRDGLLDQAKNLWAYLGLNVTVMAFVISLMHPFRNPNTALWRWVALGMWGGAAVGMALYGVQKEVSGNQLHVIFLPLCVLYGLAFLLVLWNRLNISFAPLRTVFLCLIFLLAGAPMLLTLIVGQKGRIQWPPYVPPIIGMLNSWYGPKEVLCSDMPWAVAWYANRKCLLLPETIRALNETSDYSVLGSPVVGLYLTPVTGNLDFIALVKGPYKEWGQVIMRTVNLNDFLLKKFTALPIDGECILYSDTERWNAKSAK